MYNEFGSIIPVERDGDVVIEEYEIRPYYYDGHIDPSGTDFIISNSHQRLIFSAKYQAPLIFKDPEEITDAVKKAVNKFLRKFSAVTIDKQGLVVEHSYVVTALGRLTYTVVDPRFAWSIMHFPERPRVMRGEVQMFLAEKREILNSLTT